MKTIIKITIIVISLTTVLSAEFGATEQDCAYSINTYSKYATRVVKSLELVGKADRTDIDLAIKYGIDTLSDCDKYVKKDTLQGVRNQIKYFSGTK